MGKQHTDNEKTKTCEQWHVEILVGHTLLIFLLRAGFLDIFTDKFGVLYYLKKARHTTDASAAINKFSITVTTAQFPYRYEDFTSCNTLPFFIYYWRVKSMITAQQHTHFGFPMWNTHPQLFQTNWMSSKHVVNINPLEIMTSPRDHVMSLPFRQFCRLFDFYLWDLYADNDCVACRPFWYLVFRKYSFLAVKKRLISCWSKQLFYYELCLQQRMEAWILIGRVW